MAFEPPNERRNFVHKKIIGAVKGFATGGVTGAVSGFVTSGGSSRRGKSPRPSDQLVVLPISGRAPPDITRRHFHPDLNVTHEAHIAAPASFAAPSASGPCPPGEFAVLGQCVDFLGTGSQGFGIRSQTAGGTAMAQGTGQAVVGSFGMPAMIPEVVGSIQRRDGTVVPIRRCGSRMVLGTDDLCYPKALLPRRSKFRKWRAAPRPAVSAADTKAIRQAGRAKDRVLNLAKDVGLFASKTKPKTLPKAPPHPHLLKVISEDIN